MHRFGQAMFQVETCSMDALLQAFKSSIRLETPFFESLSEKPPKAINELFKRTNKYAMLEKDLLATTSPVLVSAQATQEKKI